MKGVDNSELLELLEERFGLEEGPADAPPFVDPARHVELAKLLRDERGYHLYGFVTAVHYEAVPPKKDGTGADPEHYEVLTGLRSLTGGGASSPALVGKGTRLAVWRCRVEIDGSLPTLVGLFAGADWQEREQYDLVGVRFEGHPDLRRIMMPEDWPGHPLRRDYAIDTRHPPWR